MIEVNVCFKNSRLCFCCSLESKVKDAMHRAFWDILEEKLKEDPPDLSHAVILLAEVKEVSSEWRQEY